MKWGTLLAVNILTILQLGLLRAGYDIFHLFIYSFIYRDFFL